MKIKTFKLIGITLDWAVAKCLGVGFATGNHLADADAVLLAWIRLWQSGEDRFSSDWALGGPIKEREKIETRWIITDSEGGGYWQAANLFTDIYGYTHQKSELTAAMRCFVAGKLGEEVDIPDAITNPDMGKNV